MYTVLQYSTTVLIYALGTSYSVHSTTVLIYTLGTSYSVHSTTVLIYTLGTSYSVHSTTVLIYTLGTSYSVHSTTVLIYALGTSSMYVISLKATDEVSRLRSVVMERDNEIEQHLKAIEGICKIVLTSP